MESKFNEEIEGLMVEITYEYEEGDEGDYWTPPTGDRVTIISWRLLNDEKKEREEVYPDFDDKEWDELMGTIDHYVYHDAEWDILEWKESLRYIDFDEN